MAGKEDLQGERQAPKEPMLPESKLGKVAYQLITDFKQALRGTPELAQTLLDIYLADTPHQDYSMWKTTNPLERAVEKGIDFPKGNYEYFVKYKADTEKEEFYMTRSEVKQDGQTDQWDHETVTLSVYFDIKSRRPSWGGVQYVKFKNDKKPDEFTHTPDAVEKVREFITANFGVSPEPIAPSTPNPI